MQQPETTQMRLSNKAIENMLDTDLKDVKYVAAGCEPRTAKQTVFSSL